MSDFNTGATEQFEFRGSAGEWFGIWIVNLLLSAITFGIYSAWAKVRRKKYFYNNTYVAGRNFDYHATGGQILLGRVIYIGGSIAFSLMFSIFPIIGIFLVLGLLALIPWLIVKSMQFNARVSSFSNVRFNFVGKTGKAFVVFILMPFTAYIILGVFGGAGAYMIMQQGNVALGVLLGTVALVIMLLALPLIDRAVKIYVVSNYRLGSAAFDFTSALSPFAKALGFALLWVIAAGIVTSVMVGVTALGFMGAMDDLEKGDPSEVLEAFGAIGLFYLQFFIIFLPATFIYQALIRNTVYNQSTLNGGHRFRSTVGPAKLLWIAVSNAVAVIFTLGLMMPWAQVRLHNYMVQQTFLLPGGSLDDFIGQQTDEGNAVADAFSDLEGVDFGVPL